MTWKDSVRNIKQDLFALYLSYKDPRVPWYAKLWLIIILAYAFSPIDLIPDFIPVLGYLDDLLLLPLGILLAIKLIPEDIMEECRQKAELESMAKRPVYWAGALVIALLWLLFFIYLIKRFILT